MNASSSRHHHRKDSRDHSSIESSNASLLGRFFKRDAPSRDRRASKSTLPTYGSSQGGASNGAGGSGPPGSTTPSSRAFYVDLPPVAKPSNLISVVRNLLIRPIYILSRKPLYPVLGFVIFFFVYISTSSSSTSQRVTSRVKGAVGPYIPQRAADAVKWGSARGFGLGTDNLMGGATRDTRAEAETSRDPARGDSSDWARRSRRAARR